MESNRELITQDIQSALESIKVPPGNGVIQVFRQQREESGRDTRASVKLSVDSEDRAQHASGDSRIGILIFLMEIEVQDSDGDSERNKIVKLIEDTLDADRTRGGLAVDSECIGIIESELPGEADGSNRNYATIEMLYQVEYLYERGNT